MSCLCLLKKEKVLYRTETKHQCSNSPYFIQPETGIAPSGVSFRSKPTSAGAVLLFCWRSFGWPYIHAR